MSSDAIPPKLTDENACHAFFVVKESRVELVVGVEAEELCRGYGLRGSVGLPKLIDAALFVEDASTRSVASVLEDELLQLAVVKGHSVQSPKAVASDSLGIAFATFSDAKAIEKALSEGFRVFVLGLEERSSVFRFRRDVGKFPIEYLESLGLLNDRVFLVNPVWITSWELDYVAKAKSKLVVCPIHLAKKCTTGFVPIYEAMEKGIEVCLASCATPSKPIQLLLFTYLMYRSFYGDDRLRLEHVVQSLSLNPIKALSLSVRIEYTTVNDPLLLALCVDEYGGSRVS